MLHFLYLLFIAPLEFLMRLVLEWSFSWTHSWGWSLVLLSLAVNTAILPIYNRAERWQEHERALKRRMFRHEAMLRRTFKGQKRFFLLSVLRKQTGYSYGFTLRASVGLFLQVPFFFAAYHLLSHFSPLNGQSFVFISDLGAPDALLTVGGFSINVLPIAMTAVNLFSAFVYTRDLTRRDKAQIYAMAALFLVLLYDAASALTLYWTLNNAYSLCKNIVEKDWMQRPAWRRARSLNECRAGFAQQSVMEGTVRHCAERLFSTVHHCFEVGLLCWLYTCTLVGIRHGNVLDSAFSAAMWRFGAQCVLTAFLASLVLTVADFYRTRRQPAWRPAFLWGGAAVLFLLQLKLFTWELEIQDGRFLFEMWNGKGWLCFGLWTLGIFCFARGEGKVARFVERLRADLLGGGQHFGTTRAHRLTQPRPSYHLFQACLLPPMGLIYGHLYLWGKNAHMFTNEALLGALGIVLAVAALIFGVNYGFSRILRFFNFTQKKYQLIFSYYISAIFTFLMLGIFKYDFSQNRGLFIIITFFFVLYTIYYKKIRIVMICLTVMLCFSGITFISNSLFTLEKNIDLPKELYNIKLKKSPNIYMFWLESYHDFDVLKRFYKIDNIEYKKYLDDNQFIIRNNVFSSGRFTLMSFVQLYSFMNAFDIMLRGNMDADRAVRNTIGGNKDNIVFRVLKNNGYRTIFITQDSPFYFENPEMFLDETDIGNLSIYRYIYPIIAISIFTPSQYNFHVPKIFIKRDNVYSGNLTDRIKIAMQRGKEFKKPYIINFQGGANHTPHGYNWKTMRSDWIVSDHYKNLIKNSDIESKNIIDYIIENDPGSIIILLGDHGALSYAGFPTSDQRAYSKFGIDVNDVFDDSFRVLLAYRLPFGRQDDISYGKYINNINIFLHFFAYLSEDPSILKYRTKSISEFGDIKMIEGQLVMPE